MQRKAKDTRLARRYGEVWAPRPHGGDEGAGRWRSGLEVAVDALHSAGYRARTLREPGVPHRVVWVQQGGDHPTLPTQLTMRVDASWPHAAVVEVDML